MYVRFDLMKLLTSDSLELFLKRFYCLDDGIIRRVEFIYHPSQVNLVVSSQDVESSLGWSNILLRLDGVSEFVLRESQGTCQILSNGFGIKWFDTLVFISLYSSISDPESIEEFRKADCYAACRSISWEAVAYAE
jgi:hypothetical protein